MALDKFKNVYVAGLSSNDIYTIKYSSFGATIWEARYARAGIISDLEVGSTGTVYFAGAYYTTAQNSDYLVVKYSSTTGVEKPLNKIPVEFSLKQNFPNPFNPSTTISFSLPSKSHVSLKIYDVMGRDVATLASEELTAGTHTRQWIADGVPSGVYFYCLQAGSFIETKKILHLR